MNQMPMGEFCWNELATADVGKAKAFYGKVFDWQFEDLPQDGMTYTIVKSKGAEKGFAGIWQIPSDKQNVVPPHWMAYILVKDVRKSLAMAKENGAQEVKEVTEVSQMGLFAIITDPTGAHVALWETL